MKNELILSVETSDDEWFEIFSYEETETDIKDITITGNQKDFDT